MYIYISMYIDNNIIIMNMSKNSSIYNVLQLLIIMLLVLSISSLLTVLERKGLASSQRRLGPSYNGWFGLIQIVMDGIKLVYKDYNVNLNSNNKYIMMSCIMNFIYSYLLFLLIYVDLILFVNIPFLLFVIIIVLMINHISIIICGIVINNSKWTMLSSIRLIILFIIYDIIFLLLILLLSYNNVGIVMYYIDNIVNINNYISVVSIIRSPIIFVIYLFIVLIESGRIPIDLVEAESELIAGYNIEYSGFLYALFASSEYSVMLFHTFIVSLLFFSYYSFNIVFVMILSLFVLFILIRSTLPRLKYTSLINVSYYTILPICLSILIFHV